MASIGSINFCSFFLEGRRAFRSSFLRIDRLSRVNLFSNSRSTPRCLTLAVRKGCLYHRWVASRERVKMGHGRRAVLIKGELTWDSVNGRPRLGYQREISVLFKSWLLIAMGRPNFVFIPEEGKGGGLAPNCRKELWFIEKLYRNPRE